jgi:uncharacterized protein YukJ
MAYKPTDTFIPSNTNSYFSDDSSGAAKSYKFSITKPTTYPGEETTNGFIWLLDLEALSKNNLNSAQQLAGRDFKSEVLFNTKPLFYPTKGNYYIFTSIFSFPEKNPKNGSELHDPFNNVDGVDLYFRLINFRLIKSYLPVDAAVMVGGGLIRLNMGIWFNQDHIDFKFTSLDSVEYGELKPSHTVDDIIDVALDYIKNIYIDIVYGRRNSTKWLEAIKENSRLSTEEISKVYDDIGKLGENKVSFFIDNNEPENIPENIQETDTNKSENLKNIIFNVQKEGIFSNSKFGELKLIGESGVDTEVGFNFGNEDDLSDLLLDDEFRETEFEGDVELIMKEPDEDFRNLIEESTKDVENNPTTGDSLPNSWFNYSSYAFGAPDENKTYSSEYKSYIDSSKMPKPKMTKRSLIDVKLKVEGGLTGNPNDSAAKKGFCPTPKDGKKYHTNKGVTYAVWKSIFGSENDKRFLEMSHGDWVKVFDSLYWNKHGKSSKYESVNALLVSYAWGGSKDPTISGAKKILGVNSLDMVSEAEAVAALISARAQLFINISQPGNKNNTFRKGWINATNAFVKAVYLENNIA